MDAKLWPEKYHQSGQINITDMDNGNNLLDNTSQSHTANTNNNENECNRNLRLEQDVHAAISDKARQKVQGILEQVNTLIPIEKLLLYLKLPTESGNNVDPLRQSLNPLGSRSEIHQTIMWIKTHLEEDPELSLQKEGVYVEYTAFCEANNIKPLSTADFGKVMKQVYPNVKPRRLGIRGQSKYCYSGLRRRVKLSRPMLPDLAEKPLSTEAQYTESDLMAAAWIIIKQWSEIKLNAQFKSVPALAHYLVNEMAVGAGSHSAYIVSQMKDDISPSFGYLNKHRETTLQLQRKLQQKNEGIKEHKRKQLQSPRLDLKSRNSKKLKTSSASTSCSTSPVGPIAAANDSKSSPPSQEHSPVCDSANLQTLPDFNCFQRPSNANDKDPQHPNENGAPVQQTSASAEYQTGKVPIPRITNSKQPPAVSPKRAKNNKYKAIQPKPNTCDRESFNPKQTLTAKDLRSQQEPIISKRLQRLKNKKEPTPIDETEPPLLPRERMISLSQVNKNDLDEYLGGSNSQEQEEEIMQYLNNNNDEQREDTKKLSQLRLLLEQSRLNAQTRSATITHAKTNLKPAHKSIIPPNLSHLNAKRRVSFDTQETVPPSPNTRRQNFNFTPISPLSPNGRQSKCSSTTASPFVSPRNTPVPRARGNSHPYVNNLTTRKLKFKPHNLDITGLEDEDIVFKPNQVTNLPMSAPPSPKTNPMHSMFMKNYSNYQPQLQSFNEPLSPEVSQLFTNNIPPNNLDSAFRSQSVPNNLENAFRSQSVPIQNQFFADFTFNAETTINTSINEFSDMEFNNDNINVNKIIDDIDDTAAAYMLPQNEFETPAESLIDPMEMRRSHSNVDVNPTFANLKFPSRSVPNTPIPAYCNKNNPLDGMINNIGGVRRASAAVVDTFVYHPSHDCLLNGQPIKEKESDNMDLNYMRNLGGLNDDKQQTMGDFGDTLIDANFGAKPVNTVINESVDEILFRHTLPE